MKDIFSGKHTMGLAIILEIPMCSKEHLIMRDFYQNSSNNSPAIYCQPMLNSGMIQPFNAEAIFVQRIRTQRFLKAI